MAREEERMDELVRRAERSCAASGVGTDGQSGMGSYFWSDSLGVCWDGREQGEWTFYSFFERSLIIALHHSAPRLAHRPADLLQQR